MPLNRLAERTSAESALFDYLKKRPSQTESDISRTAADVAASRGRTFSSASDIAGGLATRFNPDIQSQFAPAASRVSEDLEAQNKEALGLRRIRESRENLNKNFSVMLNRLVNAGVDRTQAENVSRQFALDEENRKFKSTESEKDRQATLKQADIRDAFNRRMIEEERRSAERQRASALKNGLIRSLFGAVATIGTAAAIAASGGTAAIVAGTGGAALAALPAVVGEGATLMEQSAFVSRKRSDYERR